MKRKVENLIIMLFCIIVTISVIVALFFIYKPNQNALGALASVSMDTVCIFVLIILVINLTFERKDINHTTRLFLLLLLGTVVALFFDFLTWLLDGSLEYGHLSYIFIISSLCMGAVLAFIFVMYLNSYMDDVYGLVSIKFSAKLCGYLNIIAFLITVVLAFTKTAFVIVDGHYTLGALYDVVTVIPILTLLYMTGFAIRNVRVIGIHDVIAVAGYIMIMITGAIIEAIYGFGATYVSLALADVFIFVLLQNKFIDRVIMMSKTDGLTGLFNRYAYEADIRTIEKNGLNDNFVYVSMDVNSLKTINDSLGHAAGDEMIIGACECMKQCFGNYGKLYRIGGDEFVALIYADDDTLEEIKKSVIKATEAWKGKFVWKLSISCGYVTKAEAEGLSFHQIGVLADKRMYEEKTRYYQKIGVDKKAYLSGRTDNAGQ